MGAAGRKRVQDNFTIDLAVTKTLAIYDELWQF